MSGLFDWLFDRLIGPTGSLLRGLAVVYLVWAVLVVIPVAVLLGVCGFGLERAFGWLVSALTGGVICMALLFVYEWVRE